MQAKVGQKVQHVTKGSEYEVIAIAVHTEQNEELVIYKQTFGSHIGTVWARPRKMFEDGRFVEIGNNQ